LDLEIVARDAGLARAARSAFLRFGKGRDPAGLNFAECVTYAFAQTTNLPLLFKGDDFSRTVLAAAVPVR
jgi:ribonuclease VapC